MAEFTRVNGDFQPVMHQDTGSYTAGNVNAVTLSEVVNVAGPKLDFFTVTLANVGANTSIAYSTVNAIQSASTIAMYEFVDANTLAIAVYPAGAYTTTTLASTIGGGASANAGATFGA